MGRPHIEFVQANEIAAQPIAEGAFAGARRRLLSEDDATGAWTALLELPAGFATDLAGCGRPVELFGLAGDATLAGAALRPGCYAYVDPTPASLPLVADAPVVLLAMLEDERPPRPPAPVEVIDSERLAWADRTIAAVPAGLTVKLLRSDPERGDRTWLAAIVPGWTEHRAERHPTVEEALVLRGDGLLGEHGEISAGSYFWRPSMVDHGPMTSRGGQLTFFRTKGGDLDVTYTEVPGAQRLLDDYHARAPYFAPR